MAIDALEDAVASAAVSQGFKASAESMTQAAIQLAGSTLANGLIVIPGKGSISPADFVRDLPDELVASPMVHLNMLVPKVLLDQIDEAAQRDDPSAPNRSSWARRALISQLRREAA